MNGTKEVPCGAVGEFSRQVFSSNAPWERTVGYSRAVRVGPFVYVAGTTAVNSDGVVIAPGDAFQQARYALRKCIHAVETAGGTAADVVRTRMYVADIDRDGERVGQAHLEELGSARPVATMVQICRFIDPALLVEVEMDAIIALT